MPRLIRIARADEIPEQGVRAFDVGDLRIIVCRVGGEFFALDEICSHQYASLAEGWLENHTIECPMHGAQFDIRTGEALTLPATEPIRTYNIQQNGQDLYLELEDAE